jgi:hypothetical protein
MFLLLDKRHKTCSVAQLHWLPHLSGRLRLRPCRFDCPSSSSLPAKEVFINITEKVLYEQST